MPLIARMAFVKSMEDQNLHSGSAKKSDKLLYIDTEVNALYSLKKHFKKVYMTILIQFIVVMFLLGVSAASVQYLQ